MEYDIKTNLKYTEHVDMFSITGPGQGSVAGFVKMVMKFPIVRKVEKF